MHVAAFTDCHQKNVTILILFHNIASLRRTKIKRIAAEHPPPLYGLTTNQRIIQKDSKDISTHLMKIRCDAQLQLDKRQAYELCMNGWLHSYQNISSIRLSFLRTTYSWTDRQSSRTWNDPIQSSPVPSSHFPGLRTSPMATWQRARGAVRSDAGKILC